MYRVYQQGCPVGDHRSEISAIREAEEINQSLGGGGPLGSMAHVVLIDEDSGSRQQIWPNATWQNGETHWHYADQKQQ